MNKFSKVLLAGTMALGLGACSSKPAASTGGSAATTGGDYADKKVGIAIYQFNDNFMTLFRTELEDYLVSKGFDKSNITITDGANDQATQTAQIDNFITQGVDVMIVNPVNSSSAPTITDKVTSADIPLVYINREPDEEEQKRWKDEGLKVTYVGADARQSGTYQGELILETETKGDINGDGVVSYIMIEGDPENVDAQYRTEYSVKALTDAGTKVKELDDEVANWDQAQAQEKVQNALSKYPEAEVVFCNNDAMALGALEAIKAAGKTVGKDIYLVGVDALADALDKVEAGKMTGTVLNDHIAQSHGAADAAMDYLDGKDVDYKYVKDYVKVTKDNIADIKKSLGL